MGCGIKKCETGSPWPNRNQWYLVACYFNNPIDTTESSPSPYKISTIDNFIPEEVSSTQFGLEPVTLVGMTYFINQIRETTIASPISSSSTLTP